LIGRSMEDVIVTPYRSKLIPGYNNVKSAAMKNGALGFAISGSGPSVFAFCRGEDNALQVKEAIDICYQEENILFNIYVSQINKKGTFVIDNW
ncbi:MAG: homoserine kinase, partial [Bacteroidales bacterium]